MNHQSQGALNRESSSERTLENNSTVLKQQQKTLPGSGDAGHRFFCLHTNPRELEITVGMKRKKKRIMSFLMGKQHWLKSSEVLVALLAG